jgi:uncharacterized protein with GYD domain
MPTYIALIDFTEQGVRNIQDTTKRADALAKTAKKLGGTVKNVYWTTGAHDGLLIVDAPDCKTAAALFLTLGKEGNVRTRTLRAFDRSEIESILGKMD